MGNLSADGFTHLRQAVDLHNQAHYFEAHEEYEILWRRLSGEEKDIVHGLLLYSVICLQIENNNPVGALKVVQRCEDHISSQSGNYYGIPIDTVKESLSLLHRDLEDVLQGKKTKVTTGIRLQLPIPTYDHISSINTARAGAPSDPTRLRGRQNNV